MSEQLITIREATIILRVSRSTIYRWMTAAPSGGWLVLLPSGTDGRPIRRIKLNGLFDWLKQKSRRPLTQGAGYFEGIDSSRIVPRGTITEEEGRALLDAEQMI